MQLAGTYFKNYRVILTVIKTIFMKKPYFHLKVNK